MMNRHLTFALVALALAGFGCGDDDGMTTMTSEDMGTTPTEDMGTTPDPDMGTTTDPDMGTTTDPDMGTTSDRDPEGALADTRAINERISQIGCECDMGTFETVDACVAFGSFPAAYETCEDSAYADDLAASGASQVCIADALEAYANCLEDAACDVDAEDACFEALLGTAGACPEGSAAFDTAVDACVASTITGDDATSCPDQTLTAGTVGDSVASGTTLLAGDDFTLSCNEGGSPDVVVSWTAPATASFVIDTAGSDFDTALAVFDGCEGAETACNDDSEGTDLGYLSEIVLAATEGTEYFIVVDGYDETSAGDFVLNINEAPAAK